MRTYLLQVCVLFIIGMFFCPSLQAQEMGKNSQQSIEYVKRLLSKEHVYIWNAFMHSEDEDGYNSLTFMDEGMGDDASLSYDRQENLLLSFNLKTYKLVDYKICSTLSNAMRDFKKLFHENVFCLFDVRNSNPYLLMIGQNYNEILKEQIDKHKGKKVSPLLYTYKVKN